jgi:ElaB/YqjD/DUF883 family membrane-anchored ribosome-binding protein
MATPDEVSKTQIQSEIEETREALGETVDALATKLDVKSRAHEAVAEAKEKVPVTALVAVAVAAAAALAITWWWRRR